MLTSLLFRILALLPPASPPAVVAVHPIAGAVVFDLDRGDQLTVVIDDDGVALSSTRAHQLGAAPRAAGAGPTLPHTITRIDQSDDGATLWVHGDGQIATIALAPRD